MSDWKDSGIRIQVILMITLPVLVISFLLTIYIIQTRLDDADATLGQQGQQLARHLAPISEFGIFTGDHHMLQRLASKFLEEQGVNAITIMDHKRQVLVRAVADSHALQNKRYESLSFVEPVYQSSVAIEDFSDGNLDTGQSGKQIVGWVQVDLTPSGVIEKNAQILRNSLLISFSGLLFCILLGLRLSRRITRPIIALRDAIDALQNGQMNTRVEVQSTGELGALEEGFNTMAEAISASQRELQRHVEMATTRLRQNLITLAEKNIQLEEARLQALHSGEEKSAFLFNMSHEIRTPLNAIIGYTQLIEKTPLDLQQREYAHIVRQASRQLLSIIDDILNFSRLDAGKVRLEQVPFNLHECCENTVAMMMPLANEKNIDLALLIHSDVPQLISGDPSRFSQILTNLLSNALKFTHPEGNIALQLRMDEHREKLSIVVIDTGIGMDNSAMKQIFEQFRQGDDSITRRYGGTGLGLAIVARLVELMEGQIHVDSTPGKGTTFCIQLPCHALAESGDHEALPASDIEGMPCLIFDRNPIERRSLRNHLLLWGAEVFIARKRTDIADMLEQACQRERPIKLLIVSLQSRHRDFERIDDDLRLCRQYYQGDILLIIDDSRQEVSADVLNDQHLTMLARPVTKRSLAAYFSSRQQDGQPLLPQDRRQPADDRLQGLRILLAEDNELNRRLASTLLEARGCQVVTAINGHHALNTLCADYFDLLLLDIHLPELDGIELARQIRAMDEPMCRLPIITLTADIYRGRRQFLQATGINGCLFKPLDEDDLWRCILAVLGGEDNAACWPGQSSPGEHRLDLTKRTQERTATAEQRQLFPQVIKELTSQRQQLLQSMKGHDRQAIIEHSHQINGLAGYFGLGELLSPATALEQAAPDHETDLAPLVDELMEELDKAIEKLTGECLLAES